MLVGRLTSPVSVPAGRCPLHCQATVRTSVEKVVSYSSKYQLWVSTPAFRGLDKRCRPPLVNNNSSLVQIGQVPRPATSRSDASIRAETTRRIKTLGETGRARDAVSALAQMARLGEYNPPLA